MKGSMVPVPIRRIEQRLNAPAQDLVAVEEPLQIRVNGQDLAITMRTPGHDRELTAGFLHSEGIVGNAADIADFASNERGGVDVTLRGKMPELGARNFYMTSSCGVCGKASIEALGEAIRSSSSPLLDRATPVIHREVLLTLPDRLRAAQSVFEHTGGLHGAGLFDAAGALLGVREDVGRHNAVDKLIGGELLAGRLPLNRHILMLSGRVSFELVQKARMAGIPVIAAVGAPSSLAIETALRFGMTLVGFLRGERFNVYSGAERLLG